MSVSVANHWLNARDAPLDASHSKTTQPMLGRASKCPGDKRTQGIGRNGHPTGVCTARRQRLHDGLQRATNQRSVVIVLLRPFGRRPTSLRTIPPFTGLCGRGMLGRRTACLPTHRPPNSTSACSPLRRRTDGSSSPKAAPFQSTPVRRHRTVANTVAPRRRSSGLDAPLPRRDRSIRPMRRLLRHLGYHAHGGKQGLNRGRNETEEGLLKRVLELHQRHGRPISLVGCSIGVLYAREVAKQAPEAVRHVITGRGPQGHEPGSLRRRLQTPLTS